MFHNYLYLLIWFAFLFAFFICVSYLCFLFVFLICVSSVCQMNLGVRCLQVEVYREIVFVLCLKMNKIVNFHEHKNGIMLCLITKHYPKSLIICFNPDTLISGLTYHRTIISQTATRYIDHRIRCNPPKSILSNIFYQFRCNLNLF